MKLAFERKHLPVAAVLLLTGAGVATASACSTTQVNGDAGGGSGTSGTTTGTSGTAATGASGTTAGSTGSTGSVSGSTGSVTGTSGTSGTVTTVCTRPPTTDGGYAPLIDFSKACTNSDGGTTMGPNYDGGTTNLACFGSYPSLYGGTFPPFGPTTDTMPDDAANAFVCTTYGTQNTFGTTLDTVNKQWIWAGEVTGFTGDGIYIGPCVDASQFSGIELNVFGTVGAPDDGGASDQMQIQLSQLDDWGYATAGGTCLAADGGPGANCNPFIANFSVPATPGVPIDIPWSAFSGGSPDAQIDPAHIIQLQWQLPWPCQGGVPYQTNVTFQTVAFYK